MKLVKDCFIRMSILSNRFGVAFHQLQVILESQFLGFQMMVERSLQDKLNITDIGETNNDNNDFLNAKGDQETQKSLIGCFALEIFDVEC